MFPSVGNGSDTATVRRALEQLRRSLPAGWQANWEQEEGGAEDDGVNGVVSISSPHTQRVVFAAQVRKGSSGGSARATAQTVKDRASRLQYPAIVLTDFANPALRDACAQLDVSYADATGWVSIHWPGPPGLLVRTSGADRSPWVRGSSNINKLDGPGASKIIRALWKFNGFPVGVRELTNEAKLSSPGTVSKVLPALESYGAIERDSAGRIIGRSRRLLLERWTQDYSFLRSNRTVAWYLAPRGLDGVFRRLETLPHGLRIRSTGPLGARNLLPGELLSVTPLTLAAYYTEDIVATADQLQLMPASRPAAANAVLAEPKDLLDEDLGSPFGGSVLPVPPAQVLADLFTMGGRYPELAEQLFTANRYEEF